MKRVFRASLVVALLAALGLLSASRLFHHAQAQEQSLDQQERQIQDDTAADGRTPKIIRHRIATPEEAERPRPGSAPVGSTGSQLPAITYHGGALIPTPTIYIIWYGNWNRGNGTDTPQGQTIVRDFAKSIGGSNYFLINTSFSAGGYNISGGVNFGGETTDAYSQTSTLTDTRVRTVVNNAITSGRLPYNANGVYFVLSSSDVSESSGFCTQYCGWHTSSTPTAGHIRYSFVGNAARCLSSCAIQTTSPNSNAGVDGMISVMAHELEEATTDADPVSGWVDSGNAENGDKCAWTFGSRQFTAPNGSTYNMTLSGSGATTRNYLIQRNLASDSRCYTDWINRYQ
jgi:hypothetical protein